MIYVLMRHNRHGQSFPIRAFEVRSEAISDKEREDKRLASKGFRHSIETVRFHSLRYGFTQPRG